MLRRLGTRIRSLWNGITRSQSIDAEMQEEFRLHLEMRTEDLVRRGVAPDEAARLARLEFGKTDHHRQDARRARGLGALEELRFSLLDLKLGARMLVKYPGLTFVGGLGIAIAIAFSTTFFAFSAAILSGLPLDEGDRIVGLDYFDTKGNDEEQRIIHDVEAWRTELKSITDIGARQSIQRNLFTSDGRAEPVTIAEMSASGFRLARVPAMLGRHLLNSDEIEGAPPVLVIGHDVWRARFGSDSSIIGRQADWAARRTLSSVSCRGALRSRFITNTGLRCDSMRPTMSDDGDRRFTYSVGLLTVPRWRRRRPSCVPTANAWRSTSRGRTKTCRRG